MAAAGANPLADIDWNSPDINALLSNLFGTAGGIPPATPAASASTFHSAASSSSHQQQQQQSSMSGSMPPAAAIASSSMFQPSAAGSALRSLSPDEDGHGDHDTSSSSSDEGTINKKKTTTKTAKRKSKASASGGGAASTHGPTGVEGKKGRTASSSTAQRPGALAEDDDGEGKTGRKSSGGGEKDESKLKKRKEQNRAAQRAFRERKEKHVKDLEDKVAELAAMSEGQKSENENLRDLLSRLQKENVMLKQQAFTFSLPSGISNVGSVPSNATKPPSPPSSLKDSAYGDGTSSASGASSSASPQSTVSSADSPSIQPVQSHRKTLPHQQLSTMPPPTAWSFNASTPSSSDSPSSLFGMLTGPDTPPSAGGSGAGSVGFSSTGFNAFTAPTAADLRLPSSTSSREPLSAPSPVAFAFSPGDFFPSASSPSSSGLAAGSSTMLQSLQHPASPYQVLASNPLFTSFNPGAFAMSPTPNSNGGVASPPSSQLADLFPNGFDDFLRYSSGLAPGSSSQPGPGSNDVAMSPDILSLLNYPNSVSSTGGESSSVFSGSASAAATGATTTGGGSPDSTLTTPPSSTGASPAGKFECDGSAGSTSCPTTAIEFVTMASRQPDATFGGSTDDVQEVDDPMAAAARAVTAESLQALCTADKDILAKDPSYVPTWARRDKTERDAFFYGQNHIMLSADPNAKNVKLHQLWEQITATPGYTPESFDLDGLCNEMKCKAKCDGSGPVLEEREAQQILEEVPYRIRTNPMFGQWPSKQTGA